MLFILRGRLCLPSLLVRFNFVELDHHVGDRSGALLHRPFAAPLEARAHVQTVYVARPASHRPDDCGVGPGGEERRCPSDPHRVSSEVVGVFTHAHHHLLDELVEKLW